MSLKKPLFIFVFALFGLFCFGMQAKPAHAAVALVQTAPFTAITGAATSTTCQFPNHTTVGDLLVVSAYTNFQASSTFTIGDGGDTFNFASAAANNIYQYLWYAYNISQVTTTITISITPSNSAGITCAEFSGVLTSSDPLDAAGANSGDSASYVSNNATSTQNGDLFVGGLFTTGEPTITPSSTPTWMVATDSIWGYAGDEEALYYVPGVTQGTYSNSGALSASQNWWADIAAFKAAPPPPPPTTDYWLIGVIHLIGNFIFH